MDVKPKANDEILLVEDDDVFRNLLVKYLRGKNYVVRDASNGLVAKSILEMDPSRFAVIVSDVRMPGLDGIELLKFVRSHGSTPFIMMTGFSEVMEAKQAFELGANSFLPKPVRAAALVEAIESLLNPVPPKAVIPVAEQPIKEFCQIHVDEFMTASHLVSDVYIKLGEKFVKIAHKNDVIPVERLHKYQANNVDYLYVLVEDFKDYVHFNIKVSNIIAGKSHINRATKLKILGQTAKLATEMCFVSHLDAKAFGSVSQVVQDTLRLAGEDEDILGLIDNMQNQTDWLYRHSLAVSLISTMIAKEVGWRSSKTLFNVSLCGLMHDIGKRELDPSLFSRKRIELSYAEIAMMETHTSRGRDILTSISCLPQDVSMVAYEHHEKCNSSGYPQRLKKEEIHPLARLVHVADVFTNLIMPVGKTEIYTVPEALERMEKFYSDEMDKLYSAALSRAFEIGKQNSNLKLSRPA